MDASDSGGYKGEDKRNFVRVIVGSNDLLKISVYFGLDFVALGLLPIVVLWHLYVAMETG